MTGSALVAFASLLIPAAARPQQPDRLPFLYLATVESRLATPREPIQVTGNQRIRMMVSLRTRAVEDRIEQLEIDARNQHPDYFKHRPPPNITLAVERIDGATRSAVAYRVNSSGGGKSLTLHYRDVEIDILEEKPARERKIRRLLERMALAGSRSLTPETLPRLIPVFDESFVDSPPGVYEIVARYSPSTPDHWRGTLVSTPLRVRVTPAPDPLERLTKP